MENKLLVSPLIFILISTSLFSQINFEESDKFTSTSSFYAVQVADMNNDGLDDVIGATNYLWDHSDEDAKIFLYYQDTLGKLHKEVILDYPKQYPGLKSMAIGDMDNNSLKDIIIAYSDSIGISYQTGINIFSDFKSYYCARTVDQVLCKDMNNDSLADIVVKNYDYHSVLNVFYQTETGLDKQTLSNPKPYAYILLDLGDFNNDSLPDIVHHYTYYNPDTNVFIMKNAPTDGFSKEDTSLTYSGDNKVLDDLISGDYNTDGNPDVLALDSFNDSVFIWSNAGNGFSTVNKIKTYEYATRIGIVDFNCDCMNEIFSVGSSSVSTQEYFDSFMEYRTFHVPNQYASLTNWYNQFSIGDLNKDGKPDLAMAFLDGIVIMKNTSTPEKFSSIDTIYRADTIITGLGAYDYKNWIRIQIDVIGNVNIYQVDSFEISANYINGKVKLDTAFIRKGEFCHKSYIDTLLSEPVYNFFSEYTFDTTLIYSSLDTVFLTGTDNISRNMDLKIFPNPATDCLNISLPVTKEYKNIDLEILSLDGKILFKKSDFEISVVPFSINLNDLKSGVYLVKINSGGKTFSEKIIKK